MASGWNLWVWLVSGVVRRYIIDILIIIITFPYSVLSPTVKSREFYLHDDVIFPAKRLTFMEKNRGVKFVLVTSSLER